MRLVDRFRQDQRRAITTSPWGVWPGDDTGPTWAGANVTTVGALQLLAVYGSVRLIVDSIAPLPLDVYRRLPDGSRQNVATPDWLETPTVGMSRTSWLSQVLTSLLLAGNAYIAVLRGPAGSIVELVALDPGTVTVTREAGRRVIRVDGTEPAYQVVHIPALILAGADTGMSPVEAARQSIGQGLAAQEYGARFFGQGAQPPGVIQSPNDLTPEDIADLAKQWQRLHSGKAKAGLPGVLVGGMTWQTTGVTNEQAQFLETRGFTAAEIAGQMFLLDPSDLGIPAPSGTSITYANLEQRNARRVQVALLPWIVRIETALSALLAAPRYVKFNLEGLLRGDQKTRFEAYALGLTNRFLTVAEVRDLEDLPPLPEAETPPPPEEDPDA